MLGWCRQFNICCFLDNHAYEIKHHQAECLVAAGAVHTIPPEKSSLAELDSWLAEQQGDWVFGHFSYELKSQPAALGSPANSRPDPIAFPHLCFFVPDILLQLQNNTLTISCLQADPAQVWQSICNSEAIQEYPPAPTGIHIRPRMSREQYLEAIRQLQAHILRGDCYEINYCQEFFATDTSIDPLPLYQRLTMLSPTPFAAYYRLQDRHLLCASPERFLRKKGNQLCSQPIKGTIKRNQGDAEADQALIQSLQQSGKDKSENVMVVDLVRNDLSRVCRRGTVQVTELFGIYSFPQVHQMISTIEGELDEQYSFAAIIDACFPMGSMTGAPKKRVMELIEQYEYQQRGLYSGAVGYIDPQGDFDFNVVIRSILYNAAQKYLGYQVGGGITFYSDAVQEYEECLLKAAAIRKALGIEAV